MIELRWKVEKNGRTYPDQYGDDKTYIFETTPVLQYRQEEGPRGEQWWSEWRDVPTKYIET